MSGQGATHTTSVRVGATFRLPALIRSLGHEPEEAFAAAGIDPELYRHPENRISTEDLGRFLTCAARITGHEDIALLNAGGFEPAVLGLVGQLAAEGPDVRTAIRNLIRLLPYNTRASFVVLSDAEDTATLRFDLVHSDFPGAEYILEGGLALGHGFMRWLCGDGWKPDEVHLSRRGPADARPFQNFFGARVRFSSTHDALLFASDWLARSVPREERRQQSRRLEIAGAPFGDLVRRQVAMELGFGQVTAENLAHQLGVSRRQLFRRLQGEGTSCQAIVDDVKFSRARHLLAAGDAPIAEIAFAMGYPDQSSFTRAFVRWSGRSPNAWRKAQRSNSGVG